MFDVLPGVTGGAQVNGRKEVPWPERIELNVWYAQHMSLGLDLKIDVYKRQHQAFILFDTLQGA